MNGFYARCFALLQRYNIKDLDQGLSEFTVIKEITETVCKNSTAMKKLIT